ncbi:hypothetical protein IF2G_09583 [Cordyceps javanica]|nr:hypothetical protein IF2G_09583 [Cordyceps javanica]
MVSTNETHIGRHFESVSTVYRMSRALSTQQHAEHFLDIHSLYSHLHPACIQQYVN